jgi:Na+-transporting methylmalonyl-CoA/oxaloacetate decarboxylase gamma subunit
MSVLDSLFVALLVMVIVFIVLIVLCFLVKIQSVIFNLVDKKKAKPSSKGSNQSSVDCNSTYVQNGSEVSSGQLDLIGVDEKTAAMIMAIVSDELKVSLSELQFKSIKAID